MRRLTMLRGRIASALRDAEILGALPSLSRDAIGLAGVASIAYGAWLAYHPAGFIVGGALVLAILFGSASG